MLFLVPSISLLSQSLREWSYEATVPMRAFAVCSDTQVGKQRAKGDDRDLATHDLALPATTDPARLIAQMNSVDVDAGLTVVFSTYQSIDTIAAAQKQGLGRFDLIVCDEAHRTTGVTLAGPDESAFVRVHDDGYLGGDRRLYMTATPRIYSDETKQEAKDQNAAVASMDDESLYGPEFHRLGFGKAVEKGLLTDYKVLILTIDEGIVARTLQTGLAGGDSELNLDDAAKIIGCWNALAKRTGTFTDGTSFGDDTTPMKRAVAFARSIADSKAITANFNAIVDAYEDADEDVLALRSRPRRRHLQRAAPQPAARLAQAGPGTGERPHPVQRALPVRRRRRAEPGRGAVPAPAQLGRRRRPVRRPGHAPRRREVVRLHHPARRRPRGHVAVAGAGGQPAVQDRLAGAPGPARARRPVQRDGQPDPAEQQGPAEHRHRARRAQATRRLGDQDGSTPPPGRSRRASRTRRPRPPRTSRWPCSGSTTGARPSTPGWSTRSASAPTGSSGPRTSPPSPRRT